MLSDRLLFNSRAAGQDIGPNLFVWGVGSSGQLGLGDSANRSSPVQLSGTWTTIAACDAATLGLRPGGGMFFFGQAGLGESGLGDTVSRSSPTQIAGTWHKIAGVSPTARNFMALRADGSLWTWGHNVFGQLGLGDTIRRSSPTQVAGTWVAMAGGYHHSLALRGDGTLWMWGLNTFGQLGLGDVAHRSSPVQLTGTWAQTVSGGADTSGLVRGDGSLWLMGNGSEGSGLSDAVDRSSPVQVSGVWREVEMGGRRTAGYQRPASLGIKDTGALFTWGRNNYGGLGHGDTIRRSSPTQIAGTWKKAAVGYYNCLALTPTGSLFSWGGSPDSSSPLSGLGDTVRRSSPVQVAGTWVDAFVGSSGGFGLKI